MRLVSDTRGGYNLKSVRSIADLCCRILAYLYATLVGAGIGKSPLS